MKTKQDMKYLRQVTKFLGYGLSFTMMIILSITFYYGFLTGNYTIVITINDYGEAIPEAILLPIIILISLIGLYDTVKDLFSE